jgi:hypothetical protein
MKRYQSAEWSSAIDFPAHWNIFPPVLSNSAHEVIRFASKEEGNFHIAIIFRAPRDPKQTTDESLSSIQQHLESSGFGNFKPGEAPAGSRMLATLDFSKPKDGRTWSCRYYLVKAGTLEYRIGFGLEAAVLTGFGALHGYPIAIGVMDFRFLGASVGPVALLG